MKAIGHGGVGDQPYLRAHRRGRSENPASVLQQHVLLSATEFKLLSTLARYPDEVVTTNALLKEDWGAAHQGKKGYVRVYMHALRQKIEADPTRPRYLVNEAGLGYRLNTTE